MRFPVVLLFGVALLTSAPACAQQPAAPAASGTAPPAGVARPATPAPAAGAAKAAGELPAWRDVSGYRFPPLARVVADMQNLAHALQLRDYCADRRVADDFVRERLARFSRITGREETCATLRDY